jgi:hypothetical protein
VKWQTAWSDEMSIFAKFFRVGTLAAYAPTTGANLTTTFERNRLGRTMPGETGARAGSRYGLFV